MNRDRSPDYRARLSHASTSARASVTFRTLIVLLVVVSTLPLVVLTGVLLSRLVAEQRDADERRLLQLPRAQALILSSLAVRRESA